MAATVCQPVGVVGAAVPVQVSPVGLGMSTEVDGNAGSVVDGAGFPVTTALVVVAVAASLDESPPRPKPHSTAPTTRSTATTAPAVGPITRPRLVPPGGGPPGPPGVA